MTVSVDLPVGSPGTPGAAAPVSNLGEEKILSVIGDDGLEVDVEFTPDGTNWFRLRKILAAGKYKFSVACASLRASIPDGVAIAPTNMDVSADDGGTDQVVVAIPSADGDIGASVNTSALGDFSTVTAAGLVSGEVIFEASEDDVDFLPCFSVDAAAPFRSGEIATNFLRARRVGGGGESITGALVSANNPVTSGSSSFAQAIETYVFTASFAEGSDVVDNIKVFDDFRKATVAMQKVPGPKELVFNSTADSSRYQVDDDTLGPYELLDVTIAGKGATSSGNTPRVEFNDSVVLANFRRIGGNVRLHNSNDINALVSDFALESGATQPGGTTNLFDFGVGATGGPFPEILNDGTMPFFDLSTMGRNGAFRVGGRIRGATPAFDFGANDKFLSLPAFFGGVMDPDMMAGSAGTYTWFPNSSSSGLGKQTLFTGTAKVVFANANKSQMAVRPQPPLAAATAALALSGGDEDLRLEWNTHGLFNTSGGNIAQPMPEMDAQGRFTFGQTVSLSNKGTSGIIGLIPESGTTIGGVATVAAIGVWTLTGNVSNGDQSEIGGQIYTFQTVLVDAPDNVLIGASASDTIDNWIAAITDSGGAGTTYGTGTVANAFATAAAGAGDTMDATALDAVSGLFSNTITTTDPTDGGGVMSWGAFTLIGGAGGYVVPAGTTVELRSDGDTDRIVLSSTTTDAIETYIFTAPFAEGSDVVDNIKVFDDFRKITVAMQLVPGPKKLVFNSTATGDRYQVDDDTLGPCELLDVTVAGKGATSSGNTPRVEFNDGVVLAHFRRVAGNVRLHNSNDTNALVSDFALESGATQPGGTTNLFIFGTGDDGPFPEILNDGTMPFFDLSTMGRNGAFRVAGRIRGATPALSFGANDKFLSMPAFFGGVVDADMMAGSAGTYTWFPNSSSAGLGNQTLFTGTAKVVFANANKYQMAVRPQPPIVPSTIALLTSGGDENLRCEWNTSCRFNAAGGDIAQTMPPVIENGRFTFGQEVTINNTGASGKVTLSRDGSDTLNGGTASFDVQPGVSVTLKSDGVSDARIVSVAYLPAAAYDQSAYSTASRVHAARTAANPGAITAYSAHASGAVTVTSNGATDLDTTAAALETLRDEVADIQTQLTAVKADSDNSSEQVNSLIDDSQAQGGSA